MNLYILRHAHAADMDGEVITTDADRPLTDKGHHQVELIAEGFKRLQIPVDAIFTSPLVRARETAEGVCKLLNIPNLAVHEFKRLIPGSPSKKLSKHLMGIEEENVILVGHEPDLSEHTAWFIGNKHVSIKLAKGAIACLSFPIAPGKDMGELQWLLTPKTIEALIRKI